MQSALFHYIEEHLAAAAMISKHMKQTAQVVLLLLVCGTQLYSQAPKHRDTQREQSGFGAEGDFEKPIAVPAGALQSLLTSRNDDDQLQMCAEQEGIPVDKIPASWFVASAIRLSRSPASGLVLRGEHPCLGGAHIAQFWVLEKSMTGYNVVFRARADGLRVLPTRTEGYRDLQLTFVTQAGAYVDHVNFRYRNGQYHKGGHHLEHSN